MKVIFLNILDGCKENDRFDRIIEFVKTQDPDILALSELNEWDASDRLKIFQKRTGYQNIIFCKANTGYNLGLFSKKRFSSYKIIKQGLWHGLIIADIQFDRKKLVFAFTHLSPKDEDIRIKEIKKIVRMINKKDKIVFLGDMNSLSPKDGYNDKKLIKNFKYNDIKKFGTDKLRKEVISKIERFGFVDAILKFSRKLEFSVPSPINTDKDHGEKLRLDYVFLKNLSSELEDARIIRNKKTDTLSDHYPVMVRLNI